MISQQKFPEDFLWGASTASHQVEGGTVNQWSVWELAQAADLAMTAEKRLGWLPDWEAIKTQAHDPQNYVSGKGVDHYNRYEEDFDLLKKLQFNSLRFGIEWARINPEEGIWDKEAIAHYHDYIDALRKRNIEPVMNIWHWTMPTWFTDKGGFEKKENLEYWERFVRKVAEEYADKVDYVLTLNEPNVYTSMSYLFGEWPPQQAGPLMSWRVYGNLARAHREAYIILKSRRNSLQIGIAAQLANIQAKRPHNIFDSLATKALRYAWNWRFLNQTRRYQDFIGINYYYTDYYKGMAFSRRPKTQDQGNEITLPAIRRANPSVPLNDLGFYMEPEGLYPILVRAWARYKKPIIITENGVADRNDQYRQWWIEQTVIAIQRAMSEGVEVKGYMHWSLLDNFEWKFGWWPKFGLIEVDRENGMQRKPRASAIWFAKYLLELKTGGREVAAAVATATITPQQPLQPVSRASHLPEAVPVSTGKAAPIQMPASPEVVTKPRVTLQRLKPFKRRTNRKLDI